MSRCSIRRAKATKCKPACTVGRRHGVHLGAVLDVSRGDVQREQVAQHADGSTDLRAFTSLVSVVAGPAATLRRRLQGAIAADGWLALPSAKRSSVRRSWTMAAKTPAASQRKALKTSR